MVLIAVASLVATVAIPLMTKAVIDGPVRHQDQHGLWVLGAAAMGVGVSEAVLWFIRRWLSRHHYRPVVNDFRTTTSVVVFTPGVDSRCRACRRRRGAA